MSYVFLETKMQKERDIKNNLVRLQVKTLLRRPKPFLSMVYGLTMQPFLSHCFPRGINLTSESNLI